MKKTTFVLLTMLAMVASSCSLSKFNKEVRQSVNGSWTLTNIDYDKPGIYEAILFNDVDADCFAGSDWFFRNNNSTGTYTIKGGDKCSNGLRYIRWSINELSDTQAQLQFKFIDEKKRDINPNGYRLTIEKLDAETMVLYHSVNVEGSPLKISYTFKRTNL